MHQQQYCFQQVRTYDYERSVALLVASSADREALTAFYALRIELERVQYLVKEPMMGLIRFEWWREAIQKMFAGDVLRQQVLEALNQIRLKYPTLAEEDFIRLIDAYQADFEIHDFSTKEELWNHAEILGYPLLALEAKITGFKGTEGNLKVLARSIGLKQILMTLPTKNHFLGIRMTDPKMNQLIQTLITELNDQLAHAPRSAFKGTSLAMTYDLVERFAKRLKKAGYHVALLQSTPDWLLSWYLFRKKWLFA